jgi:hypothetical protein
LPDVLDEYESIVILGSIPEVICFSRDEIAISASSGAQFDYGTVSVNGYPIRQAHKKYR